MCSFIMKPATSAIVIVGVVAMVAMVVLLSGQVQVAEAANCDVNVLLDACGEQLKEGGMPTTKCCGILEEQETCICKYPERQGWPGIIKISGFCHHPFPPCA
ncbi:hypothetical protein L6452_03642 [Arctium lappa]|uniref:Uncharacterized protein n=1 Tax=Arctium lappa TaxID=4217 RepID=A0ACB9FNQ9_ARCLA|nr:hypothetical protein L6452_03642 [Arctium lappa]